MAVDTIRLPKDRLSLCRVIEQHAEREELHLRTRSIMWKLAYWYLNGFRRFDVFNPRTGAIQPHFVDEHGNLEFQSQELVSQINKVASRLASLDARPRVHSTGTSLDSMRQRAVSQVILDAAIPEDQLAKVQRDYAYTLTCLGSAGITGYVIDHPTIGLTTDLEVIHPSQIRPFPSPGMDHTQVRGIMRERVVSVDFLKEKFGKGLGGQEDDLESFKIQAGEPMVRQDYPSFTGSYSYNTSPSYSSGSTSDQDQEKSQISVARVRELWLDGPRGTCARYIVSSGEAILDDLDFTNQEVYCPIGFDRFYDSGTFHGLGLFDILFGLHRQFETLLKSFFNNVRDMDKYGVLVIPTGQWNERTVLRDVGPGLRVLPWEPDPLSEGYKPFPIQPFNAGDMPGKTAQFAKQLLDSLSPSRDIANEKGRVDSFSGLQYLDEQINQPMSAPAQALQRSFGTMYRGVMAQMTKHMVISKNAVPVARLSLDLAGASIDPEKNTVSFSQNPLPDIGRQVYTIKETNPRSEAARKSEAVQLFEMGLMDEDGFKLHALKEGLNFSMWMDEDQSAVESVTRDILLIYNDGVSPGAAMVAPYMARPDLQLRVLGAFLSSIKARMASKQVIEALKYYRELLIQWMGLTLPAAVQNPDDYAMLNQVSPQMMVQGPGGMPAPMVRGALPPGGAPQGPSPSPPPPQGSPSRPLSSPRSAQQPQRKSAA